MPDDITRLLSALGTGESGALNRLVPLVYDDLRRVARGQLRRRRPGDTLNTTGLVHEAYERLADQSGLTLRDRGHFFAVSAIAMRQIVVDHARRRGRLKRGGDKFMVPLDEAPDPVAADASRVLVIDEALQQLSRLNERLARVVECRYFGGLSEEETAAALGISVRTTQREWFKARAWLRAELGAGPPA